MANWYLNQAWRFLERSRLRGRDFIKDREQLVVMWFLFFVVASMSFAVGYLVAQQSSHTPIVIEQARMIN
ncbi:MAG: hypothetical protein COU11_03710 [Candidatus Harrisonbacteria bacterium CG10_big_fil_rev_8_21_14_0_10_49_15]|uniref:Uncharacterized protein n=1 Tax=Candidatus Harrisonbacteria bacterium CG10_big_fil_rev_8_21_14_0_10_49_15 TaxID=1974587 RepID=A0A2H0UK54_9BACT|nr:MAG: hypothetical protein COU11_03710 [Candidatus Harrisonbacteria bacterium CG10_big_fil_rev_8_21_14_0_10_49_15]